MGSVEVLQTAGQFAMLVQVVNSRQWKGRGFAGIGGPGIRNLRYLWDLKGNPDGQPAGFFGLLRSPHVS